MEFRGNALGLVKTLLVESSHIEYVRIECHERFLRPRILTLMHTNEVLRICSFYGLAIGQSFLIICLHLQLRMEYKPDLGSRVHSSDLIV